MKKKYFIPAPISTRKARNEVLNARSERTEITLMRPLVGGISGATIGVFANVAMKHPLSSRAGEMAIGAGTGAAIGAITAIPRFKRGTREIVQPALRDYQAALNKSARKDKKFRKRLLKAKAAGFNYIRIGRDAQLYPSRTDPKQRKVPAFRGFGYTRFKIDDILKS